MVFVFIDVGKTLQPFLRPYRFAFVVKGFSFGATLGLALRSMVIATPGSTMLKLLLLAFASVLHECPRASSAAAPAAGEDSTASVLHECPPSKTGASLGAARCGSGGISAATLPQELNHTSKIVGLRHITLSEPLLLDSLQMKQNGTRFGAVNI